jgi:hypothetical protein
MVVSPAGLGTKNDCAGEDQQLFTGPDPKFYGVTIIMIVVLGLVPGQYFFTRRGVTRRFD